jgi:beta-lactamase regulating signal transducer with metallopeptidase domain
MTFDLNSLDLQTIAQFSALRIVESLAGGAVIGIFAAGLLWFARRQSAATKYAIGFAAMAAIALLPAVSLLSLRSGMAANELKPAAVTVPDSWAVYLFAAWAMVASWFLIGVVRSFLRLRALRKSCMQIEVATLDPSLQEAFQRSQIKRHVVVCTSEEVRVPTALGLVNPAIVIPSWAMEELSTDELKQILLHELAHLRRWDDWTNLAQQVVKAVFFFHPAVWWIESKAALEREIACDDAVLEATGSSRAYAECLAHLAERSFLQQSLALAQAAIGKLRQTSSRVARILDGNRASGNSRVWKLAVSSVAGFAVACAVGVSRAPKLIAFESSKQVVAGSRDSARPTTPLLAAQNAARNGAPTEIVPAVIPASMNANQISPAVHIVPAKFNLDSHDGLKKALKSTTPLLAAQNAARNGAPAVSKLPVLRPKAGRMVHLASIEVVPAPTIEAVLILVQTSGSDSLAQIQMWHVTVVRFVQEPDRGTTPPRKT